MLGACSNNNAIPYPTISASLLAHSIKGYGLYSWQANDQWYFTLITGTNRLKTIEEITSYHNIATEDNWVNIRVQGMEELKTLLGKLPKNEYVFWASPQWFEKIDGQPGPFKFPSQNIIDDVREYCKQISVDLTVSD
jgi:hypothetical protein